MNVEAALLEAPAPVAQVTDIDLEMRVQELNLSYLLLAQRLLREGPAIGMFRLGISSQVASIISGLSMAQVMRLAMSPTPLCDFRITNAATLETAVSPKKINTCARQLAILLAGQPALQIG